MFFLARIKVQNLEKVRDDLIKEKEERLANGDLLQISASAEVTTKLEEVMVKLQQAEHQRTRLADTNTHMAQKILTLEKVCILHILPLVVCYIYSL